jgi:hypothetical protein
VAARGLALTAWWGLPLTGLAVIAGLVLPDARPLVPLTAALWISIPAHEAGHARWAARSGSTRDRIRVRRRGPGLVVDIDELATGTARQVALAGIADGCLAATAAVLVVASMTQTPLADTAWPLAVVLASHLANLSPWTPDGRHIWACR